MVNIRLDINIPDKTKPEYNRVNLCDKVTEYIGICNSDDDSEYEWQYLKAMFSKLKQLPKLTPELLTVYEKLDDFFSKTEHYSSGDNNLNSDGKDFFLYRRGK